MSAHIKEALEWSSKALSDLKSISSSNISSRKGYVVSYLRKMKDEVEREMRYVEEVKKYAPDKAEWGRVLRTELEAAYTSLKQAEERLGNSIREIERTRFDDTDDSEMSKKIEDFKKKYHEEITAVAASLSDNLGVETFAEGVRRAA